MNIKSTDYSVEYEPEMATVKFQGSLRLNGSEEYAPIIQLLDQVVEQHPSALILDLQRLNFLNSSGINILSKFIIRMRQQDQMQVIIRGTRTIPWHERSMKNLQRLMPALQIEID